MNRFCFLFFLIVSGVLQSANFENAHHHYSTNPIDEFFICGERCSGTNFVNHLFLNNFPSLKQTRRFGFKHFLWWYEIPLDKVDLNQLNYQEEALTLSNSEHCLFIFIVRDPYDWLRSFYLTPQKVHPDLVKQGFDCFIRTQWKIDDPYETCMFIDHLNPWTNQPFTHILELRKYKILNYLHLGTLVSNYVMVRYEDVRDHPQQLIDFISKRYNLNPHPQFIPVDHHFVVGKSIGKYQQKTYFPLEKEDLDFINLNLDWELENQLGYFKKEVVIE